MKKEFFRRRRKKIFRLLIVLLSLLLIFLLLNLFFPLPQMKPFSKTILARDGTLLAAYLSPDDKWRMETHLEELSPELIKAVLVKEDKWFYWHWGVNPVSVIRAVFSNIKSGRRTSGASTITMQVARMLSPKERTYRNKIVETFRAVQLEFHHSKKEILEMYFNLLPYGGNVEGVKAASFIFFNRPPDKLSLSQAILLSVIPNRPNSLRVDKFSESAQAIRDKWIRKFIREKIFPKKNLEEALNEPIDAERHEIKILAPHFSYFVSRNYQGSVVRTTLDLSKQKTAEGLLKNYLNRVKGMGVSNGAVIVIDNKTSSVIAYCGSADFSDEASFGQVNGVTSLRSPGSALKPSLYALAFDMGLLTPKMKMLDVPTDFGGYAPENFDLKFNGEVTAEFALMNSLNIPAVRLVKEVGLNRYLDLLKDAEFKDIADRKDKLGLSVILGGCGVTLEELTHLFTVFAHEGILYPLNYTTELKTTNKERRMIKEKNGVKLFSDASAFLIADILSGIARPDLPNELAMQTNLPKVAWKTGTSYGKKDAWAVGFNKNYTIGVWMGNFTGQGVPDMSGATMAVPLLFELFNSIDYNSYKEWIRQPSSVGQRIVCTESGNVSSLDCEHTTLDYFIKNVSPNTQCNLYKEIYVDEKETVQYCTECLPRFNRGYKKKLFPIYEPELTLWLLQNNKDFKKPPPHNPDCERKFSDAGPKITSPTADYEYFIDKNESQEIMLQAASDAMVHKHFWYINDVFFQSCNPGDKIFFKPLIGKIKISCADDNGRTTSVVIAVKPI